MGTAVDFISLNGYTPDVFFASVSGRMFDADVRIKGFVNYFFIYYDDRCFWYG